MPSSILLVDDDADSRELLGELLRAQGHDVYLSQNGKEALTKPFELAVLNQHLARTGAVDSVRV